MPDSRVISKRIPVSPGRDSRFTIRNNPTTGSWWVYYQDSSGTLHPADLPHIALVQLVNKLKVAESQYEGGGFSINEHSQVIARMAAPPAYGGQSIHVIGLVAGVVATHTEVITFNNGALSPLAEHMEGETWSGPLCGSTYSFVAPGNAKEPSRNFDEVYHEVGGQTIQLSSAAGIKPYPPTNGPLTEFLGKLRSRLPIGGSFRVNEHRRAFTSNGNIFIGIVPLEYWFRPLTAKSV